MSIKLRLEKGAIAMQAILADEAFTELLATIQKHEFQDPVPSAQSGIAVARGFHTPIGEADGDPAEAAKVWLSKLSASEVLNSFKWDKKADTILLLGAHYEAKGGGEGWRSADMEIKFSEAKEPFPGNFSRDVITAIKDGFIATVTPRTYKISRTGWNRVGEVISKLPLG